MIQAIELKRLRNDEYIQFNNQFLKILENHNPTTLQVKDANDELSRQIGDIESVFKSRQGSDKTEILKSIDVKRDDCITGIYYYLLGLSSHFNDVKSTAAKKLLDILKVYGSGIASQNYNAETATLNSLVTDFNLPENVALTNTLGITDWVQEMDTQNKNFDALFLQRNKEAGLDQTQSIELKRIACNAAYMELKDLLNSYYTITKKAAIYENCINELNALIGYYNNLLNNRVKADDGATNPTNNTPS